jgi:integrase/recombinase XerC
MPAIALPADDRLKFVRASDERMTIHDPVALLLADKRSLATKKAYDADLKDFFGGDPAPEVVRSFLALPAPALALRLNVYKAGLLERGASEATVNRRLSAVRSLLKFSHRLGLAATDGRGLADSEKVRAYRDTRGVSMAVLKKLMKAPGTATLRGRRDTAIMRLLCENALRCAEVLALDVADFDRDGRRLTIIGKGRGTQKEAVTVSQATAAAISAYLDAAGHTDAVIDPSLLQHGALFRSLDHRPGHRGDRITANGLRAIIADYGRAAGIEGLTPHKLRHSAITAALDATNGDVRRVQRLSRHRDLRTLMVYDDNRHDLQDQVTEVLSGLLDDGG